MYDFKQSGYPWSSEDLATYLKWRRWVVIVYGSIGVVASIAAVAWSFGF